VTEWENGDGCIALILGDGFIVSEIGDENHIKQSRLTGLSAIILRNNRIVSAGFPGGFTEKEGIHIEIPPELLDNHENFTYSIKIYNANYNSSNRKYKITATLLRDVPELSCRNITLCFECDEPLFCWDGYAGDEWYENRINAVYEELARLGFELNEVKLNEPNKTDKITVFKYPEIAAVYTFRRAEDTPGFVLEKAADIGAAASNLFSRFMSFYYLYSPETLAKYTESELKREHFILPTVKPGVWNEVRDDADIERLQTYFGYFHDSFIVGLEYSTGFKNVACEHINSGWPYEYVVNMRVQSSAIKNTPIIEMRFEDVKRCGFTGAFTEFFESYLKFVEGLDRYNNHSIVWAGDPSFDPHNITGELYNALANFVIASGLKWRLLKKIEER